jgi:hypothetical protein
MLSAHSYRLEAWPREADAAGKVCSNVVCTGELIVKFAVRSTLGFFMSVTQRHEVKRI